eukprot:2243620-Prymnesium_polylepis.1
MFEYAEVERVRYPLLEAELSIDDVFVRFLVASGDAAVLGALAAFERKLIDSIVDMMGRHGTFRVSQGEVACGGGGGDRAPTGFCTLSSAGTLRAHTTRAAAAPNNLRQSPLTPSPGLVVCVV